MYVSLSSVGSVQVVDFVPGIFYDILRSTLPAPSLHTLKIITILFLSSSKKSSGVWLIKKKTTIMEFNKDQEVKRVAQLVRKYLRSSKTK